MRREAIASAWVLLGMACGSDSTVTTTGSVTSSATVEAPSPSSSGIGVVPCDTYVEKVTACLATMSEADKAPRREALDKTVVAWRAQLGSSSGKEGLDLACRSALTSLEADALCSKK